VGMVMIMVPGDWDHCHKNVWYQISGRKLLMAFEMRQPAFVDLGDACQGADAFAILLRAGLEDFDTAAREAIVFYHRAMIERWSAIISSM
jgi:hypothetical protein